MIIQADARSVPVIADKSVQCIVTSPPYFGLRDYGTATWEGGDAECDHSVGNQVQDSKAKGAITSGVRPGCDASHCRKCGARRIDQQIGLEASLDEYIATMVAVAREWRRVLKDDGTVWLNMGSSYASGDSAPSPSRQHRNGRACDTDGKARSSSRAIDSSYPDLCGGCLAALSSHNADNDRFLYESSQLGAENSHVAEPQDFSLATVGGGPLDVQASTNLESFELLQGECSHCENCGACLSVLRSASRDARLCARRLDDILDKTEKDELSVYRRTDKVLSSKAWRYLTTTSLKAKDDMAVPWLLALALRMDGWYLRQGIIWSKNNPMPESIKDRCTKSHEDIFLLSKSANYYFDSDAIREPLAGEPHAPGNKAKRFDPTGTSDGHHWNVERMDKVWGNPAGRNKRSVWTIPSEPTPEAHFATFPQALVTPCILAGTSEKGECVACGKNWVRTDERVEGEPSSYHGSSFATGKTGVNGLGRVQQAPRTTKITTGWRASCQCNAGTRPNLVYDPFLGSGTVGLVAERLGRRWVGTELSAEYIEIAKKRTSQQGLFSHAAG